MSISFLSIITVVLSFRTCDPCALPYWWSEQFHFPPFHSQPAQAKSTYKYRETFHQTYPNNYVHIQEYSEYTWWEHDNKGNNLPPADFGHGIANVIFSKGGGFNGFPHSNTNNIVPRGDDTNGIIPSDKRNGNFPLDVKEGLFPAGETNGMVPADNKKGMVPADNRKGIVPDDNRKGMVPTDSRNGMTATDSRNGIVPTNNRNGMVPTDKRNGTDPVGDTNGMIPEEETEIGEKSVIDPTKSEEREKNENEDKDVVGVQNIDRDDLEASSETKSSYQLPENKLNEDFFTQWFGSSKSGNETEPCKVSESDIHSLRSMIEKLFSVPREHVINPESKEKAREDILKKFREYGLQVWTQNFTTPPLKNPNGTEEYREGVNLIGVIPGSQRGHLNDEIVLVGAHYDTVADSNGVDDNGSGLAVMLEVAKAITEARCRLNHTLMFVAFDHEENGAVGSNYFVDHYLIPEELKRARARFQGAFILDGILNYNDVPNTQELPLDYAESLPGLQYFVNNTGNRGNFLAMISRNEMDDHLSQKLMNAWRDLGNNEYKLFNLAVDMGNEIPSPPVLEKHLNFLRSDHATFWYHNSSSHFPDSLNAVLLTDTGPFRGRMKECYHNKCDDLTVISPEKLQFAKKTADALTATLVELTSATAFGNQVHPVAPIYILHILVLYCIIKLSDKV